MDTVDNQCLRLLQKPEATLAVGDDEGETESENGREGKWGKEVNQQSRATRHNPTDLKSKG